MGFKVFFCLLVLHSNIYASEQKYIMTLSENENLSKLFFYDNFFKESYFLIDNYTTDISKLKKSFTIKKKKIYLNENSKDKVVAKLLIELNKNSYYYFSNKYIYEINYVKVIDFFGIKFHLNNYTKSKSIKPSIYLIKPNNDGLYYVVIHATKKQKFNMYKSTLNNFLDISKNCFNNVKVLENYIIYSKKKVKCIEYQKFLLDEIIVHDTEYKIFHPIFYPKKL